METTVESPLISVKEEAKHWEPKIVAFLCNWCSYAGADLAGVSRLQYGTNVRIIRVPCSGRVNPLYLFKAGETAMELGKFSKAEEYFSRIKDEYSSSVEARSIDIYIQRAQLAQ